MRCVNLQGTYNEKYQQNKITNADKALLKTLPA